MHDDHDLLVVTPQYAKHYEEAIKKHYPNHEVEASTMVSHGQAYLFNKQKLKEQYKITLELKVED